MTGSLPPYHRQIAVDSRVPSAVSIIGGFNPARTNSTLALSSLSRRITKTASGQSAAFGGVGRATGKWYFEVLLEVLTETAFSTVGVGSASIATNTRPGTQLTGYGKGNNFRIREGTLNAPYGSSGWGTGGTVINIAVNLDAKTMFSGKNGVWDASSDPATGASPMYTGLGAHTYFPYVNLENIGDRVSIRLVAGALQYAVPSGFAPWDGA